MSWAHYILQVNIYLIVFYGFYKLLLDKETYFILNRIYLITAGFFSLLIPFLRFEWFTTQSVAKPVYVGVDQFNQLLTQVSVMQEAPDRLSTGNIIVASYLLGVIFFIGKFIFQLLSVRMLLRKAASGSAFSFFNRKIVDQDLPEIHTIEKHEEIHVRQLHTLDILFFELVGIITWFNPIIYFYKNTVKNIHEYLADEEAAKFQGDKEQYALLLLSSAFGVTPNKLTNSFFNKSLIKKRIFMLHKQRSKKTAILKYGLFVPLFAVTLIMSSATIRNNEKIQSVADEIPLEQPMNVVSEIVHQVASGNPKSEGKKSLDVEISTTDAKPLPSHEQFYAFVKRSIRYPSLARQKNVQGNSQIKFTITKGEIEGLAVVAKPLGSGLDTEVMRTLIGYQGYKAMKDGKYTLTVSFRLDGAPTPILNNTIARITGYTNLNAVTVVAQGSANAITDDDMLVHDFVSLDMQPTFPGGMNKFYDYLKSAVKYPQPAQENNIQGKVFLSFIVEKDGSLTDIKVDRKLGSGTDEEAIRVLKASPKWVAGMLDGKPVRVKYHIPISFTLSAPSSDATFKRTGITFKDENGLIMTLNEKTGKSNPLMIVDGVPMENADLQKISPNEIETISIIKDASATALYGTGGQNGVILVTTKAGAKKKAEEKTKTTIQETKKDK